MLYGYTCIIFKDCTLRWLYTLGQYEGFQITRAFEELELQVSPLPSADVLTTI